MAKIFPHRRITIRCERGHEQRVELDGTFSGWMAEDFAAIVIAGLNEPTLPGVVDALEALGRRAPAKGCSYFGPTRCGAKLSATIEEVSPPARYEPEPDTDCG